jgi:DNA-binding PadR family transcriptional regulator
MERTTHVGPHGHERRYRPHHEIGDADRHHSHGHRSEEGMALSIEAPGHRRMRGLDGRDGREGREGREHGHDHGPSGHRAGRFQMRRGAVRDAIIGLLADRPMHGYQVMQELADRSGDRWRPSAGSIYPTLQQLEDEGLVQATDRDGRKTFELTDTGRAAVAALPTERPWSHRERGDDLRALARELGIASMQVTRVGSPTAVEAARRILTEARKDLYRLLADDGDAPAVTEEG